MPTASPNAPLAPACLHPRDAAAYLGLARPTLANWRVRGIGPRFIKAGSKIVRYRLVDLDRWLEDQSRSSTSERVA